MAFNPRLISAPFVDPDYLTIFDTFSCLFRTIPKDDLRPIQMAKRRGGGNNVFPVTRPRHWKMAPTLHLFKTFSKTTKHPENTVCYSFFSPILLLNLNQGLLETRSPWLKHNIFYQIWLIYEENMIMLLKVDILQEIWLFPPMLSIKKTIMCHPK